MKRQSLLLILILTLQALTAQNPFMPLWEHIPDGEPHVLTMCTMKPGTKIVTGMVSGVAKGQQGIFRSDTKDKSLCELYDFIFTI